jgi:hypothetical protein
VSIYLPHLREGMEKGFRRAIASSVQPRASARWSAEVHRGVFHLVVVISAGLIFRRATSS